jgi:ribonuclease BN (tRNA processing enzyme)
LISRRHILKVGTGAAIAAMAGSTRDAASQQPSSVATPLERQLSQIAGITEITSFGALGPNRLILLGTRGGPAIRTGYTQTPSANLIVYNGVPYLVDTGYGVSFKLVEAKVPPQALRYIFITHHHSDHNAEFGLLLNNAWALGLRAEVAAYGPAGMKRLADGFWEAYRFDIETRMADEGRPDLRKLVNVHEYGEGLVMRTADVTVTALRNVHPPITESFALKFAFPGKTVVFSGDTAYHPPLAEFARGADILVHEVMYAPALEELLRRVPNAPTLLAHLKASHTLTDEVGRIATQAQVKKLVLSHLVPADATGVTDKTWIDAVRATYNGEIVVARDLMEVEL